MDTVRILQTTDHAIWDYDEEADVLYLSIRQPRPAVGVDVGDGMVLRCDEAAKELVGITVIGLKSRLLKEITL